MCFKSDLGRFNAIKFIAPIQILKVKTSIQQGRPVFQCFWMYDELIHMQLYEEAESLRRFPFTVFPQQPNLALNILWKPILAYTQPDLMCWRVGSFSPSAHAPTAEPSKSTELPAWQQNTFTDKAFYYFYLILSQPQPWKNGFPTLKDAPMRNVVVSCFFMLFFLLSPGSFVDCEQLTRTSRMLPPTSRYYYR